MRSIKITLVFLLGIFIMFSCKEDEKAENFDYLSAPTNVSAIIDITQDNSGLVTIIPSAEGVVNYLVYFGDTENEEPTEYGLSDEITHVYSEGDFSIEIVAVGITGLTAEYSEEINIQFIPPENLAVTIEEDETMPNRIHVTAEADYTTFIEVYFGDVENEEPVIIDPGESTSHVYSEIGDYEITVIAKNGGSDTATYSETVSITSLVEPLILPIDFESETIEYLFTDFGNEATAVVDNPDASGINTSARAAESVKNSGAETWAGTFLNLDEVIDFSAGSTFKVKVWSPKPNVVIKLKLENSDASITHEVDATNTTTNAWEELTYDFSGMPAGDYMRVVIFFDFGNVGDGSTYYFDDIELVN